MLIQCPSLTAIWFPGLRTSLPHLAGESTLNDLSHTYQQLPLDEDSKRYVVINTHRGLFCFTRLPFGISSAPGIFQQVIESLLQGIKGVIVYLDDTGSTEESHLRALDEVLSHLHKAGLQVK